MVTPENTVQYVAPNDYASTRNNKTTKGESGT